LTTEPSRREDPGRTPAGDGRSPAASSGSRRLVPIPGRTGKGHEPGSPAPRRGDPAGYALVIGSYLLFSLTPILMVWTDAPASLVLVVRYFIAAGILLAVFWRRRPLAGVLRPVVWRRFVIMAAIDASQAFAYFYAVRELGVAVATFIYYLQPLWVALLAPRILHVTTERVLYVAIPVALAGLALVLGPSFSGAASLSVTGVAAALLAGLGFALFQIVIKRQTREVSSVSMVTVMCLLDGLFLLPLAIWQTAGHDVAITSQDVLAVALISVFTTAVAFTMWVDGVARVRVQHSAILGLLSAVASPVFAFLLLGQGLSPWSVAGGVLILAAGALVVVRGAGEQELEPPL
jgi:drug/metabolite transporter (DMT)-like permease